MYHLKELAGWVCMWKMRGTMVGLVCEQPLFANKVLYSCDSIVRE
jgi:hypothetical protein